MSLLVAHWASSFRSSDMSDQYSRIVQLAVTAVSRLQLHSNVSIAVWTSDWVVMAARKQMKQALLLAASAVKAEATVIKKRSVWARESIDAMKQNVQLV